MTCPSEIHRALSEILYWTMIEIRCYSNDSAYCFALADHGHNLPHLIDRFEPDRFYYYWECEKQCLSMALERQGKEIHARLSYEWNILEPLYETMRATCHVAPAIVIEEETGQCDVALNQEHIEELLSPSRGVSRFRVLDCQCTERILIRGEDGTYRCEAGHAEASEIQRKLLMFGGSISGFDPSDLNAAQYAREMFTAYLKQTGGGEED